jgi:hypothetical protein
MRNPDQEPRSSPNPEIQGNEAKYRPIHPNTPMVFPGPAAQIKIGISLNIPLITPRQTMAGIPYSSILKHFKDKELSFKAGSTTQMCLGVTSPTALSFMRS